MSKKNKKFVNNIVFSTASNWEPEIESEEVETLAPAEQKLRVRYETKHRGGKKVTVVEGFVGKDEDLQALGRTLRQQCGVGGSAKDGDILVQGNVVKKVVEILKDQGYKQTK
ncbi:MAG TPA: translation initiation factor [Chitinophagaceae bacterium]|nr:translation initiation factor [Chitinophagaceae bacterium]